MASLPSADQNHYTYEVFLSFRGKDTRCAFTDHLHNTLCERAIKTFRDDKLRKGEEISPALLKAIEESRVSIIVFSKNYASSSWCLDELVKILECRKSKGQEVRAVFYKVDPADVRHQRPSTSFGDAFATLECRHKDRMDEWKKTLKEATELSGWTLKEGEYESEFIKKIVGELSAVVNSSYEMPLPEHPVGIESCRREVESLLDVGEKNAVRTVGIWGTGGIGKTTIAKAVFNSIYREFDGSCFLANVGSNSKSLADLQGTILSRILRDPTLTVQNVDEGLSFIRERMRRKKVLLIVDDVSDSNQLDNLAPSDCFGVGSRIIITTRDRRWLTAHRVDSNSIYEVKVLNDDGALELFSWHAFQCNEPRDDFLEPALRAVRYAQGLPLALMALGSHLFDRSIEEATLDSCSGFSKIRDILKISYSSMGEHYLKQLFLDIACFFKGEDVDDVTPILQACGRNPTIGMKRLEEKALIRIDGAEIWMYQLIEEMGKDIVIQEGEPGQRSRLWNWDDIHLVLTDNTGTDKIKGIQVPHQMGENEICLNAKSFSKLKSLIYFSSGKGVRYSGNIDCLSNNLRWLNWPGCPIQYFPSNFHPKELVTLNIPDSCRITRLWEGQKSFRNLKYMNLSGCVSLMELPDFTRIPNLKELTLEGCESLVEVHDSVRSLDSLETLNANHCSKLITLPREISLKSVHAISLVDCKRLEEFPKITGKMDSLSCLDLSGSGIKELHPSIGNLIGLKVLYLHRCENLSTLPCSIDRLQNLETLDLSGCSKLATFPEINRKMDSLLQLYLSGSGIKKLHTLIGHRCKIGIVVSIEFCRREIDNLLDVEEENVVRMVGLWGTAGIGKTTIAKEVYKSIRHKFESSCFLAVDGTNSSPDQSLAKLQETLLFEILGDSNLKVSNVDEGISLIKERMQQKKVLLILDDVSDSNQLKKLAPSSDCFGAGSRIIITTRDQRSLTAHEVDSNLIYEVKMLDGDRALELFSWHAFKCNGPPDEYMELAQRAVLYARGLPLALIVFGSHLFKRSRDEWEAILDSFKGDPQRKIQGVLRISYDALDDCAKELFLDIACFFTGMVVDDVTPILQACHRDPRIGMTLLEEKAIMRIEGNKIRMHYLLEKMGKDIVIQEGEPGKRSRLWNLDDINHVLTNNTGTDKIKGIQVQRQWKPDDICWNATSFSKLKNLKYFSSKGEVVYSGNIDYLSNNLRWLDWLGCPLQSFPSNFHPKELVALNISDSSSITRLWKGRKICPNLTSMDLSGCFSLLELPDFTGIPNLKELILQGCESLVELHDSVGSLDRLETLNATRCSELVKLPREISLKSLQTIDLSYCKRLKEFPKIIGKMDSLRTLDLSRSGIKELHPSIGNLIGLKDLSLSDCENLTTLPCSIYGLQNLETLVLSECSKLATFPTTTKSRHHDNGDGSLSLPKLEELMMVKCNLSDANFLTTLDCLETLTRLYLSSNSFVSLPACISKFVNLQKLDLCCCERLREIPELPPNLVAVDVSDCVSLEKFWKLSKVLEGKEVLGIEWISLLNCNRLCDNLGYNMDKMEHILLNNQDNAPFRVVFPRRTSEVPKWFNCWKDVIGPTGDTFDCEFSIKISENLKWEKIGLAICAVSEGATSRCCDYEVSINEVCIPRPDYFWFSQHEYGIISMRDHVWLEYIPLPVEWKAGVDDRKGCSSPQPYYMCRVRLTLLLGERNPKGCGVHLVCQESKDD